MVDGGESGDGSGFVRVRCTVVCVTGSVVLQSVLVVRLT
jgi:hypothetical protein